MSTHDNRCWSQWYLYYQLLKIVHACAYSVCHYLKICKIPPNKVVATICSLLVSNKCMYCSPSQFCTTRNVMNVVVIIIAHFRLHQEDHEDLHIYREGAQSSSGAFNRVFPCSADLPVAARGVAKLNRLHIPNIRHKHSSCAPMPVFSLE